MNEYQFNIMSIIMFFSGLTGLFVALTAWRRRHAPGALYLMLMESAAAFWSFAVIFEMAVTTVPGKIFWSQVSYLGVVFSPYFFFTFAVSYSQNSRLLSRRVLLSLAVVPVITLIVAFTNNMHHLLWTEISIQAHNNIALYGHGAYFFINVAYAYLLIFSGIALFASAIYRFPSRFTFQMVAMIMGALIPLTGNIMYVFNINPIPGMDWTPLAFMASGLLLSLGIFRYRMLDLAPVAREKIVAIMDDGVIMLDERHRIVDMNPAMGKILGGDITDMIGRPFPEALPRWHQALQNFSGADEGRVTVNMAENEAFHYYEVRRKTMRSRMGRMTGMFLIVRDIQKEKELALEKDNLIKELSAALLRVKTLNGLLPICASCKKIRDDRGYWKNVEHYIEEHSGAEFTHGICPDCAASLKEQAAKKRREKSEEMKM